MSESQAKKQKPEAELEDVSTDTTVDARAVEMESIKLDKGSPFKSEAAAETELRKQGLDEDVWGICRYDRGYVIAKHRWIAQRRADEQEEAATRTRKNAAAPETYFWVTIAGGSGASDYVNVPVNCNGEFPGLLWLQRNTRMPLPNRLVNVLKDAHHGNYRPMKNGAVPYQKDGEVWLFPMNVHEEATEADWLEYLKDGRKKREIVINDHQGNRDK